MSQEHVDWDAVAAIRSGRSRKDVVEALHEQPKYAKQISEEVGTVSRKTVSRQIRWLEERDLAECLTQERPHHRIYGLTEAGEAVAEEL